MVRRERKPDLPTIRTWADWAKIFTDVDVWADAVRAIADRAGLPIHTIEAGYPGTNAVFVVNSHTGAGDAPAFVVKIYAPFCHEDYELERELHPLLSQHPSLPTPRLLGHGTLMDEIDWPYLVLSFLPGAPIREVRSVISPVELVSISEDLGGLVRALHRIPITSIQSLPSSPEAWRAAGTRHLEQTVEHLRAEAALPLALLDAIPGFVAPMLQPASPPELVFVTGDLTEDHVLLQREEAHWTISGLIDFADALIAPRAYEWPALWFGALGRDTASLHAFMKAYDPSQSLDAAFYRRAMAFTLLHEFGGLMITETLRRMGLPEPRTLDELQTLLWRA